MTFSIDRPDLWLDARLPVVATWTDSFTASKDDVLALSYTLESQAASVELTLPLSDYLWWLGVDDVTIDVPLGNTPLVAESISLTSLAGIPSWAASLDLRLSGSVRMHDLCCVSGSALIQTPASAVTWSTWSTETAQVIAPESPGASVRATLAYALGIGLTLSVLGADVYDIIPSSTVLSVVGAPSLETEIDVPTPASAMSIVMIGVAIAAVVAVAAILLMVLRRKRGSSGAAETESPPEEPEMP
ncbi:MAG: hypothetical protein AB1793_06855 [Candidatus Thermoplasmatota archaeon]